MDEHECLAATIALGEWSVESGVCVSVSLCVCVCVYPFLVMYLVSPSISEYSKHPSVL